MQILIDLTVLTIIFIKIIVPKIKKLNKWDALIASILFVYVSIVYALTLMPFRPLHHMINQSVYFNFNFHAFQDIIYSYGPAKREASLNVLMMVPLGFLLPLFNQEKYKLKRVLLYTFLLSLTIEILQIFSPLRSSDVTDLITNTLGGLLGYALFSFVKQFKPLEKSKK